ncbi:MAG: acyl-CoA thioesterase [Polyangia bacterium]|jgi:4-hydroxybenzoyl-CoA thioesterase
MPFRTKIEVRFGDVDHAGIVFYPQFFIYFHEAFEDFFDDNGHRYPELLNQRRLGFPTVHIETDFRQPLRYGDALDIELSVPRVGDKSAVFRYVGFRHQDGQRACVAEITCACVEMVGFKAVAIPDDLRALFARFAT